MKYEECIEYLVASGEDDWVPFGVVVYAVEKIAGVTDASEIRRQVLVVIDQLLVRGLMDVGDCADGPFEAWTGSKDEKLRTIADEWSRLTRHPRPGEVCWLANTKSGNEMAIAIATRASETDGQAGSGDGRRM